MSNRDEGRVRMRSGPDGFEIQILPLVRTRRGRRRAAAAAAVLLAASLAAAARLGQAWESGARRGFPDLPLSLLVVLSLAVGVSTPLAVIGLAALAFAEESVHVDADNVTIRRSAFEHARVWRIRRSEIECWRQTYLPLSPWWTWAVVRLAARSGGRLEPVAAAAGPKEKQRIAQALARATDRPIVTDSQALALAGWPSRGNRGGRRGVG